MHGERQACKRADCEKNLTLPVVIPETEYAALKGLADLDVANQYVWNNAAMAAYYQVESIIGVAE